MKFSRIFWVAGVFASLAYGQQETRPLPTENKLPLGPDSFCAGFKNMFDITKQQFRQEANILCPNFQPSQTLLSLVAAPYDGGANPVVNISSGTCDSTPNLCLDASGSTIVDAEFSGILATYAMRVPLEPVATILGEEKHVEAPYNNRPIQEITSTWITPPPNLNDADTVFAVEQHTVVTGVVSFDDRSVHDLKLYRLQPNNVDFFAAVRTLRTVTPQFAHSVVLRAIMRDPNQPDHSLSITVQHMIMKNHGRHQRVIDNYSEYLQRDMQSLYMKQSRQTP